MGTEHKLADWTLLICSEIYNSNAHLTQGDLNGITPAEYERLLAATAERVNNSDWPPSEESMGWDGLTSVLHDGLEFYEYSIVRIDGRREPTRIIFTVDIPARIIRVLHIAPERWFALDFMFTDSVYRLSCERSKRWAFGI